eukprot:13344358-Alexandrium_andersonii.AAC.1
MPGVSLHGDTGVHPPDHPVEAPPLPEVAGLGVGAQPADDLEQHRLAQCPSYPIQSLRPAAGHPRGLIPSPGALVGRSTPDWQRPGGPRVSPGQRPRTPPIAAAHHAYHRDADATGGRTRAGRAPAA